MKEAVIVTDVQVDFCEGGALAVEGGNEVATAIARWIPELRKRGVLVVFTKDYHNPDSDNDGHIALDGNPDYDKTWPVHCVAGTSGSDLHPALDQYDERGMAPVFLKGRGYAAYSGFEGWQVVEDDDEPVLTLDEFLKANDITDVSVCGLAADYCVIATAVHAVENGYKTRILGDLTRSIAQPMSVVNETLASAQIAYAG